MKRIVEQSQPEVKPELSQPKIRKNTRDLIPIMPKSTPSSSGNTPKSKPYRLIIQIDKVYLKPCPKSKKINQIKMRSQKSDKFIKIETQEKDNGTSEVELQRTYQCLVCAKAFAGIPGLYAHVKKHFTCDVCKIEFTSMNSLKNHFALHMSNSKQLPYKCHICEILFETKELLRNHNHINFAKPFSPEQNRIHYCKTCNITFKNEVIFRKHLDTHVEKSTILQLNETLVADNKILPKGSVFETLTPVIFNCRVCSKNFTSITDIDLHTKSHLEELKSRTSDEPTKH